MPPMPTLNAATGAEAAVRRCPRCGTPVLAVECGTRETTFDNVRSLPEGACRTYEPTSARFYLPCRHVVIAGSRRSRLRRRLASLTRRCV